MVWPRSVL
ncbi:hypothetical protein LEMLEM_LOCUS24602 [Lemmus lemmus]